MSVLAIMCWRGLDSVIRSRDRILATGDQMQALSTAMAQLDEDLRRSQPLRQVLKRDPVKITNTENGLLLAIDRPTPGTPTGQVQNIQWRVWNKKLERGYSSPENPLTPPNASRSYAWQTLLESSDAWNLWVWRKNARQRTDGKAQVLAEGSAGDVVGLEVELLSGNQKLSRIYVLED